MAKMKDTRRLRSCMQIIYAYLSCLPLLLLHENVQHESQIFCCFPLPIDTQTLYGRICSF